MNTEKSPDNDLLLCEMQHDIDNLHNTVKVLENYIEILEKMLFKEKK